MTNHSRQLAFLLALQLACLPATLFAEESQFVIEVYRVGEIVRKPQSFEYAGTFLPSLSPADSRAFWSQEKSSGMNSFPGGMGGGMGGMGGGMFQVAAKAKASPQFNISMEPSIEPTVDMDNLIEAIQQIVEPNSWELNGGHGTIRAIGDSIAVRQTKTYHSQIQALLQKLAQSSGSSSSIRIKAEWLALAAADLQQLYPADSKSGALDRQALAALPEQSRRFSGQIMCLNGQTVHLVSGRIERNIKGATPIVGGGAPAYSPSIDSPHYGALVQFTPEVVGGSGGSTVRLDVRSSVAVVDATDKPVELAIPGAEGPGVKVDRLNVAAQQFATTARIPLNQPVLIGGMTFPAAKNGSPGEQLYLVVEIAPAF